MTSGSESVRANAALVRESFEAFNVGDTERLLSVVAPDLVMHFAEVPAPIRGRDTWQQGFEMMKRAFPDLEAHVDDVVAAEDRVAVRVTFHGTHAAEFEGIPATGPTGPLRQPRVLPRRRRRYRRRMDLLRHGILIPPAELRREASTRSGEIPYKGRTRPAAPHADHGRKERAWPTSLRT